MEILFRRKATSTGYFVLPFRLYVRQILLNTIQMLNIKNVISGGPINVTFLLSSYRPFYQLARCALPKAFIIREKTYHFQGIY